MLVQVKLYPALRRFAPDKIELGNPFPLDINVTTVEGVLKGLGIESHQAKIIIVNRMRVTDLEHELSVNDSIVIFPPVGGG